MTVGGVWIAGVAFTLVVWRALAVTMYCLSAVGRGLKKAIKIAVILNPGFFGHIFVNSAAKKTQKNSLNLSTLEARSNFCPIFLGFYYLKHQKKLDFPLKNSAHRRPGASHNLPEGAQKKPCLKVSPFSRNFEECFDFPGILYKCNNNGKLTDVFYITTGFGPALDEWS